MSNEKSPPADNQCKCPGSPLCPLSKVGAGTFVCIKEFATPAEVTNRLRELGLREEQQIKLVSRQSNFICQVCNARLGLSKQLAERILVQPLPGLKPVS